VDAFGTTSEDQIAQTILLARKIVILVFFEFAKYLRVDIARPTHNRLPIDFSLAPKILNMLEAAKVIQGNINHIAYPILKLLEKSKFSGIPDHTLNDCSNLLNLASSKASLSTPVSALWVMGSKTMPFLEESFDLLE
jgi:hypothetical protein